jgi:glycolate oxidase iron-sulfur subunit
MIAAMRAEFPPPIPLQAADQCVKCGLCLPHCPTYGATLDEAESPRGRLALMHGLATGLLRPDAGTEAHLDGCLTCRACEMVCPANVPYGRLIDSVRETLANHRPQRTRVARLLAAVLTQPAWRALALLPLWLYQRLGIQWPVRRLRLPGTGRLARLESLLPRLHWPRRPAVAAAPGAADVLLFTNCTSPLVEPGALRAAVAMLEALGCAVAVPQDQGCCGAQHQHAGLPALARACAGRNVAAFAGTAPIVGVASGCSAQLLEYELLLGAGAAPFARRVRDLGSFLLAHPRFPSLRFAPLAARVLVHVPCTQRNVVRAPDATRRLLERIPGLALEALDGACCGAAGSYFVTRPAMADALLEPTLEAARRTRPDLLVSSNVGCAMHLAAGLRRAGLTARVLHPLELLAQQLAAPPAAAAGAPPARPA